MNQIAPGRHQCPKCKNHFSQPFFCTTCGAERLYDATVTSLQSQLAAAQARIAELEKHAADGWTTPDEVKAQLESAQKRIAELTKERDQALMERNLKEIRLYETQQERDEARAEVAKLKGLLHRSSRYVEPTDHEGRSADELRREYPESCESVDALRAEIDEALAAGNDRDEAKGDDK